MLALPLLLGFSLAGAGRAAPWCVVPAAVLAFLAHYALVPALQRARERKPMPADWLRRRLVWGGLYLAGAGAAFAAAVALAPGSTRADLLAVAAAAALAAGIFAAASALGSGRTLWSEIVGMAGTSLAAPIMAAAAGRPLDRLALGAAAMALAYFLSTLAFVRGYAGLGSARRASVMGCLAAHAAIGGALVVAAAHDALPRAWWIAYLPVALRTGVGLARPPANLRALGLREVWVAVSFATLAFLLLAA
jgi:hypothetical protein